MNKDKVFLVSFCVVAGMWIQSMITPKQKPKSNFWKNLFSVLIVPLLIMLFSLTDYARDFAHVLEGLF